VSSGIRLLLLGHHGLLHRADGVKEGEGEWRERHIGHFNSLFLDLNAPNAYIKEQREYCPSQITLIFHFFSKYITFTTYQDMQAQ
jgi:hypothetical protein